MCFLAQERNCQKLSPSLQNTVKITACVFNTQWNKSRPRAAKLQTWKSQATVLLSWVPSDQFYDLANINTSVARRNNLGGLECSVLNYLVQSEIANRPQRSLAKKYLSAGKLFSDRSKSVKWSPLHHTVLPGGNGYLSPVYTQSASAFWAPRRIATPAAVVLCAGGLHWWF